ncbi:MAG TPA: NAD(P)/FAD-dependent oxidoreductase [Pseudonocardia sp.]|nr:NAD(P)/FAD-dependent oxidoreductase [Pseudonocardia sp.]
MTATSKSTQTSEARVDEFDAVVVGAGFSGLYMLHRLRELGLSVRVFDAAGDVGGTWYWNRYPGARCDSESIYYVFSDHFSEELLNDWTWSERYAAQPEILSYLQHVADRFDLRKDIRFDTRVTEAVYDEATSRWEIRTDGGGRATAQFLITAVGCLSVTNLPDFPGRESFEGTSYHTGQWPHEGVDFTGQRVAVIGTGATAVQVVPEIADQVAHMYVFQRTPNYDLPGWNRPLDQEYVQKTKETYKEIWQRMRESPLGLPYDVAERSALEVDAEERRRVYETAWGKGGFRLGGETFTDLLTDEEANETASEFVRSKIRERVHDPEVAELLAPKDHPFFTKRPPLEHGYYEAFNRENVELVNVRRSPIEAITPTGVRTRDGEYEVDSIIYATGFDAMTGALFKLGIRGRDGVPLTEKWAEGPRSYLGLAVHGFPNLFTLTGPQSPSVLTNMTAAIEQHVDWVTDCVRYMRERDLDRIEPLPEAEDDWVAHHTEVGDATLLPRANSWWVGANIPGKRRTLYPYLGGLGTYRETCDRIAANGYEGFTLGRRGEAVDAGSLPQARPSAEPAQQIVG